MQRMLAFFLATLLIPAMGRAGGTLPTMPKAVADLVRIELITGPTAQDEVDTLHGKPLPAEESLVARYARPGSHSRPAEVWVSRVASEAEARRQTGQMVHMMYENPRSPFKNPARLDHRGMAVYRFEGMGQAHLIWYREDAVYWISTPPDDQSAMLDALCLPRILDRDALPA